MTKCKEKNWRADIIFCIVNTQSKEEREGK
jgi:hypothetical protein